MAIVKRVFIVNEQSPFEDNVNVAVFATKKGALRRKFRIQEHHPDNSVWIVEADLNLGTEEFVFTGEVDFDNDMSEDMFHEEMQLAKALLQ